VSVVVTLGYEGRTIDDLVESLAGEDVEVLIDVRLNAMSRKPGFSRRRLAEAVATAGIEYVHEPGLGNPKDNRPGFAKGDPDSVLRYVARLDDEAADAYADLLHLVRERAVALLCFERDHRHCHRTCIVARLQQDEPDLGVVNL
jgi:uncharacterized protein (DUF488 family)